MDDEPDKLVPEKLADRTADEPDAKKPPETENVEDEGGPLGANFA